jgi:hypothetical protein
MKLKYFFLLFFGVLGGTIYGQDKQHSSTDISNKVYFRLGEKQLDPGYRNNGRSLAVLIRDLNAILADSNYIVSKLRIIGVASPDGRSEAINIDLAQRRAESIKSYIAPRISIPSLRIEIENKGENWKGLRELVAAASYMPGKEEVLRIIDGVTDRDKRKNQLLFLQGGVPYKYMLKNFFPGLRSGFSVSSCYSSVKSINLNNWNILQEELSTCVLSDTDKKALLYIFSNSSDPEESLRQVEKLMGGKAFEKVKSNFLSRILFSTDSMSVDNWLLLEKMVAASSDIPNKEEVLRLFDVPANQGREDQLKALHDGASYQYMKDHFFSRLLQKTFAFDLAGNVVAGKEDGWKQLRYLVTTSPMDNRQQVLDVIDHNVNPLKRVEELLLMDDGITYRYLCDMYLPALLYNEKSNNRDIWNPIKEQVGLSELPEKDTVLNLIDGTSLPLEREQKLKALNSGATYRTIEDELFLRLLTGRDSDAVKRLSPLLRSSETSFASSGEGAESSQLFRTPTSTASIVEAPSRWALKTNLLYLGILMPNIEVEYLMSKRWSINVEGDYAWWSRSSKNQFYQIATVSPELRYWLSRKAPFSGHYIGLYYGSGLYDLENGSEGYRGECYLSGGLSYGYMKSLDRHLSLELGVGFGYLSTEYKKYTPLDGRYVYESTQRLNYIGPTKAKIALVWKLSKRVKEIKETK